MAIATVGLRETLATAYGAAGTWISCHTGAPGATGANEQSTTGSPAYARKATTWSPGASDGVNNGNHRVDSDSRGDLHRGLHSYGDRATRDGCPVRVHPARRPQADVRVRAGGNIDGDLRTVIDAVDSARRPPGLLPRIYGETTGSF